jgi:tetratricopeptide (TPR) repeat protein
MVDMPCAVISSTVFDLPAHRVAARDACLRQDFFPKMMEHQAPSPTDPAHLSRELVDQADVYVLILGFRYGEVAAGQGKSFTHLELDRANERGIPKLVLLMADDHPLTKADVETGPGAERLRDLREQVRREQAVNFFSSPEQLRALLIDGLSDMRSRLRPREVSFHHIRQLVTPPEPYIAHPYTLLQTSDVIGRQQELNVLTDWVTGSDTRFNMARIMIFVAIGGIGKSAVTWKWFNEIASHELRPLAGRVWWSFYESDARFDNFVTRTLAYVSGLALEQVKEMRAPDRVDELLVVLDQQPYLIVLDGLERLLLAYARPDAAHLAEDDLDIQTANTLTSAVGLPAGAAASFTSQSRLRMTADPRVGDFLRRLAAVRASRILSTSRLYPTDLQTVTGEPVRGAAAYFVDGLSDDDAVNLWRAFGVTGSSSDLLALFHTFGNYPLLIRALAGEVARYRPAPRDFDKWRKAHAEFNPFQLPLLVQRKSHILQYALSGLTSAENGVLHTIAAFRAPATYDTLAALTVGPGKTCTDEAVLDVILSDLEDRGLVGWDKRGNRYDLHPVVRGVAWSALDSSSRQEIYQNLASYFEALPVTEDNAIKSIDDLAGAIELYHTLIQLGRAEGAYEILENRIMEPIFERTWSFREFAELAEMFATRPDLMESLKDDDDDDDAATMMAIMAICYYLCGDPARALDAFSKTDEYFRESDSKVGYLAWKSMMLCQVGALAEAERSALESVKVQAQKGNADTDDYVFALTALATALSRRGKYEEGRAWLSDYRIQIYKSPDEPVISTIVVSECAVAALRQDDIIGARALAEQLAERAEEFGLPRARVQAMTIYAAVAEAQGERDRAHDLLNDALVISREAMLPDDEACLLVQLGHWNAHGGRLDTAREYASDALQIAEHGRLKLRQIDAINLLSSIERACGNQRAAASAAAEAYRLAWCDGPPFVYEWGIRQARENLAAAGESQPSDLPVFSASTQMPELGIVPTSLINALTLQPPPNNQILKKIINQLPRGDDSIAVLRTLYNSTTSSAEIRAAAIDRLVRLDEDSGRGWRHLLMATEDQSVEVRRAALKLVAANDYPDARAMLVRLLNAEQDPGTRELIVELLHYESDRLGRLSTSPVTGSIID